MPAQSSCILLHMSDLILNYSSRIDNVNIYNTVSVKAPFCSHCQKYNVTTQI